MLKFKTNSQNKQKAILLVVTFCDFVYLLAQHKNRYKSILSQQIELYECFLHMHIVSIYTMDQIIEKQLKLKHLLSVILHKYEIYSYIFGRHIFLE